MLVALFTLALVTPSFAFVRQSDQEGLPPDSAPMSAESTGEDESELPFAWIEGPAEGRLGERAHIAIPPGFHFTDAEGAKMILEANENPTSGAELGLLANDSETPGESWFVVFEFSDSGYVKDDERDELDADALMESMREGNEAGNQERKRRGWEEIHLVGWKREPFYDPRTNNLTWATLLSSPSGGESVNWSVRVLGREGVMNIDLVLAPGVLDKALPEFEKVIDSFQYEDGQRYAQFSSGDKIAEYGLAALVVGGGAAVAAKTGLLAKLWKPIVAGLAVIGAFFQKIWGWMTGRNKTEAREGETN